MHSHTSLLFILIFIVRSSIQSNIAAENCAIQYPFQWHPKLPKCHPYDYCLAFDEHRWQNIQFATKTAYRMNEESTVQNHFDLENCIPSKIWLLIRHGTRLPTSKGIKRFSEMEKLRDEILENAAKLTKSPLCLEDLKQLKQWKWNHSISLNHGNFLMPQGYTELSSIARNFRRYFPTLFDDVYDAEQFHFRHTDTERTRSSFIAFFDELFGKNAHKQIDAVSPSDRPDLLLKAYANCHLWTKQKKQLKHSESELRKFENSNQFRQLIADVNARLGFNGTLTPQRIKDIFDLCRYEQAWHTHKGSVWCSLLTSSQIQMMVYRDDLIYFYKSSHGSKLNRNIKCAAIKDMLNRLDNNAGPKTTAYFSHSAALQLFLTGLGAMRDDIDLKGDNFTKMSMRRWKTSEISPFAANIAAVRYKCTERDQVKIFLNEKLLHIDWCGKNGACDWENLRDRYAFFANGNCDHIFCRD